MADTSTGLDEAADLRHHPLRELLASKELLGNLIGRELKVRYKRSVLGFAWTLLNPLLMMAVFTAIFSTIFKFGQIDWYSFYFLIGYLPFAFFQASATIATGSVVGNAGLVTKVYFPRTVLPLGVVGSQLVHFGMAMVVLLIALTVIGFSWWLYLPTLLLAIVLVTMFATGLSLFLAAINTYFRDVAEFTTVVFLVWFYVTPVIYPLSFIENSTVQTLIRLNPMSMYVSLFRAALYEPFVGDAASSGGYYFPGLATVAGATITAVVTLLIGWKVFVRLSAQFAKEV